MHRAGVRSGTATSPPSEPRGRGRDRQRAPGRWPSPTWNGRARPSGGARALDGAGSAADARGFRRAPCGRARLRSAGDVDLGRARRRGRAARRRAAADRAVIDISGDGPNNAARAGGAGPRALVAGGSPSTGSPSACRGPARPDLADSFGAGFVRAYYEDCVIGGAGRLRHRGRSRVALRGGHPREARARDRLAAAAAILAGHRPADGAAVDCATVGCAWAVTAPAGRRPRCCR